MVIAPTEMAKGNNLMITSKSAIASSTRKGTHIAKRRKKEPRKTYQGIPKSNLDCTTIK